MTEGRLLVGQAPVWFSVDRTHDFCVLLYPQRLGQRMAAYILLVLRFPVRNHYLR